MVPKRGAKSIEMSHRLGPAWLVSLWAASHWLTASVAVAVALRLAPATGAAVLGTGLLIVALCGTARARRHVNAI